MTNKLRCEKLLRHLGYSEDRIQEILRHFKVRKSKSSAADEESEGEEENEIDLEARGEAEILTDILNKPPKKEEEMKRLKKLESEQRKKAHDPQGKPEENKEILASILREKLSEATAISPLCKHDHCDGMNIRIGWLLFFRDIRPGVRSGMVLRVWTHRPGPAWRKTGCQIFQAFQFHLGVQWLSGALCLPARRFAGSSPSCGKFKFDIILTQGGLKQCT